MAERQLIEMLGGISRTLTKAASDINNLLGKLKGSHSSETHSKQVKPKQQSKKTNNGQARAKRITKEEREKYSDAPKKKSAYFIFAEQVRNALNKSKKEYTNDQITQLTKQKWDKHPQNEKDSLKQFATKYNQNEYKTEFEEYKRKNPDYQQFLDKVKKAKESRKLEKLDKTKKQEDVSLGQNA